MSTAQGSITNRPVLCLEYNTGRSFNINTNASETLHIDMSGKHLELSYVILCVTLYVFSGRPE